MKIFFTDKFLFIFIIFKISWPDLIQLYMLKGEMKADKFQLQIIPSLVYNCFRH